MTEQYDPRADAVRALRPGALAAAILLLLCRSACAESANPATAPGAGFAEMRLGVSQRVADGNFILRTPVLVGGASYDAVDGGPDLAGFGALLRPPAARVGGGELIIGANYLGRDGAGAWEGQAKYIGAAGFGLGAGFVGIGGARDVWFVNAVSRGRRGALSYYASPLAQRGPGGVSAGGHIALYTKHFFLGGGGDGEQRRVVGAVSANRGAASRFDPALEILYVDSSVGRQDGDTFLFVNGSLKRSRGFLSDASRLGRALGPQGLEFANPVSFLSQPWSRTVDVWETGEIMNVRLTRRGRSGAVATRAEAVVFPVQAFGGEGPLRGVFAGLAHERGETRSNAVLFGHAGRLGDLSLTAVVAYDAGRGRVSGAFGLRLFR